MEELLKPRFKLIANYPDCDKHKLVFGDIVTLQLKEHDQYYNDDGKIKLYDAYYRSYPHLFKELLWWEYRTLDNLPKYIKTPSNEIRQVVRWEKEGFDIIALVTEKAGLYVNYVTPATEQEYLNQLKST